MSGREPPCECWELNTGPLEESNQCSEVRSYLFSHVFFFPAGHDTQVFDPST